MDYVDIVMDDFLSSIEIANIVLRYWSIRSSVIRNGGWLGNVINVMVGFINILSSWRNILSGYVVSQYPRIVYSLTYLKKFRFVEYPSLSTTIPRVKIMNLMAPRSSPLVQRTPRGWTNMASGGQGANDSLRYRLVVKISDARWL